MRERRGGCVKVSVVMIQLVPDYIIMFLPEAPVSSTSGNNPLPHNDCFSDCSLCRFEDDRKRQNLDNYITKLRVQSLPAFTSRALSRACLRPKWQTDLHMHLRLDSMFCRTSLACDEHSLLPARERNDFYARYLWTGSPALYSTSGLSDHGQTGKHHEPLDSGSLVIKTGCVYRSPGLHWLLACNEFGHRVSHWKMGIKPHFILMWTTRRLTAQDILTRRDQDSEK